MFQSPCRDWWPSSILPEATSAHRRQFQSPCRDWWPSSVARRMLHDDPGGFNPPVGIGGLQASSPCPRDRATPRFQSPCRDWWPSSHPAVLALETHQRRFNPPVGIGGLQASFPSLPHPILTLFQSPCRDWWPSSRTRITTMPQMRGVSIPLSGLVAFKRG